jgi:predicted transposase YdaD
MQKIHHQNYDLVLKEAFSLFHNKSLDFLGLNLPPIISFIETEIAEVETTDDQMDLNFRLGDGSILHLEEETDLTRRDLIRFAHYDLRLYGRYKTRIHTVVLTPSRGSPGTKILDTGNLQYTVIQLVFSHRDGDILLEHIQSALQSGEAVNELELIFLPLMKSRLPADTLLRKTIELEKQIPDQEHRNKIRELTLILSNRIVKKEILDELWEELRMLKVIKYAEEKGMEKGIEKGIVKGREEGIEKGIEKIAKNLLSLGMDDDFVVKATGLNKNIVDSLKKSLNPSP